MNLANPTTSFHHPGPPVPLERARHGQGRTYSASKSVAYQRALAYAWLAARPAGWPLDRRYTVAITVTFQDARRRDIDNVAKTVLDGLNGHAWQDDSQVDGLTIVRTSPERGKPGITVALAVMAL
jgi:crossover junction endodeoxyribonuclease RusA